MPRNELVNSFLDPTAPKRVRLSAARGMAPLANGEMIDLLVQLTSDAEPEIAAAATETLAGFPEAELEQEAKSETCSAGVLAWLASFCSSPSVLEAIILNANTPSSAVEMLAALVSGHLLEAILYNKVRIIENPVILVKLKQNPALAGEPTAIRLIHEMDAEFFAGKKQAYEIETPPETAAEIASPATELSPLPDLTSLEGLPIDPAEREGAILEQLARMTVPQRLKHAMFGNREVRAILIRDNNREVAKSVLRSPKLTDTEVEAFAAMRNVTDDVLREIGNSRELTRSYVVAHNLVKNPKTPPMIAQRMLSRLHTRDLYLIGRDRGIPEAVRRNAQRMAAQREAGKTGG
jgi:hypothetical protein